MPLAGPEITPFLCVALILLIPLAAAGLALINTGLGRSHSAAHVMMASLCIFAIAAGVYFICGFAWQGYAGSSAHNVSLAGKSWSWLAAQPLFFRRLSLDGSPAGLAAWLGMLTVGLAALIPLGAGIDRWRLSASCASTVLLAGWTYPLFSHWAWGGGWLAQLGVNYGIGHGFVDAGGSGVIQTLGGLTALSIAWILGPRRGKYSAEAMPAAIPGHNVVLVLLGCLLALIGWTALNAAGAMLFAGVTPGTAVLVAVNTLLCAAASGLVAVWITRVRFGKPDVSISANGWVGGLAAGSASCAFVSPAAAAFIGIIAGVLVTFSVEWFELRFTVDDPGGAVSVHALAGLWGLLAVGLFANFSASVNGVAVNNSGQWLAQVVGIATLLGLVLPLTYVLNLLLNLVWRQRVHAEGESQGMDLYELGAGAYPEFVTHGDEFSRNP